MKKGTGGVLKDGPLKQAIERDFGSLDNLKKQFNDATLGIQGSGWGWLVSHFRRDRIYEVFRCIYLGAQSDHQPP